MARGGNHGHASPAIVSLPKVEYEMADDEVFKLPAGTHDQQSRNFGCESAVQNRLFVLLDFDRPECRQRL